jgi:tetratricopeptide (TPR) repeat protein
MVKNQKNRLLIILVTGIVFSLISGFILLQLSEIPFGFLFQASLYLFAAALIFVLSLTAVFCFRAERHWLTWVGLVPVLLAVIVLLLTIIINTDYRILYFQALPPTPTKAEWIEDLHYLADQMAEKHKDLFALVDSSKWRETVGEIENRIPRLSDSQIEMELFRLTALPNDAHTFPFIMFPCFDLHSFPFKIYGFPDGWYIVDAGRGYKEFIGARILKIGSENIKDIYKKYPILLATENESSRKERFTYMIVMPEWLDYHKIIDDIDKADFTLQKKSGEQIVVSVPSVKFFPHFLWSNDFAIDNDQPPVFTNYREDWYRFEHLKKGNALYIQFNQSVNQPGRETLDAFVQRLKDFAGDYEFERCIIDIRNNDGGDRMYDELLRFLRDTEKINRRGGLFVLIGRRTFSAAVMFATQLQLQTKTIFIGEPTGQGPVFFGGPYLVELPHSRLVFSVSTHLTVAGLPFDDRKTLYPDIAVNFTIDDFMEDRDPVLETALSYQLSSDTSLLISENILEKYTGRYLLSPAQVMDVERKNSSLQILLTDFIPGSDLRFLSDLYPETGNSFKTDLAGAFIRFPEGTYIQSPHLVLDWMGKEKILERAPENYVLAFELFSQGDIEGGCQAIRQQPESHLSLYPYLERVLNSMGYVHLRQDDPESAIKIFRLNVHLFPESSNVYDSLGEGYMVNNQINPAIENYRKSLELNPDNRNAVRVLEILKK